MTRPRILHVIASLDTGGTEMWALRLLRHWQGVADQRIIAIQRSSGALESAFAEIAPLEMLSNGGRVGAAHLFGAVRQAARAMRADAVLLHCFGTHHVIAALAARSAGVRHVAASAGNPPPADARGRRRWAAVLLGSRLAGCPVAGCSHAVHTQLAGLGAGMPRGSFAIPYGIAVPTAAPHERPRGATIGMVARLDTIKDHATLIHAFARVVASRPDARLNLIGDGPLRGELEAIAASLGVAETCHFLGRRTDVAQLLDQLDLFVFSTTRAEGFGIVLIEAMAAGLPIVASDVPACHEVLAGGEAGMLVPAADAEAMADAILDVLGNADHAAHYAAAGTQRVRDEYSVETCAGRWLTILDLPPMEAA